MADKKRKIDFEHEYIKDLGADLPVKKVRSTFRERLTMAIVAFVPIAGLALILMILYAIAAYIPGPAPQKPDAQEMAAAVSVAETVPEIPESTAEPEIHATEGAPETTAEPCQVWMSVRLNGTELQEETRYTVKPGDTIDIHAGSSKAGIAKIGYYSNLNEEVRDTFDENVSITVPEQPSDTGVVLVVEAVADNDDGTPNTVTKTGWEKYYFVYE